MKYLIDTNIFIYFLDGINKISPQQEIILLNPANEFYLSQASVWEMAIKVRRGNLTFKVSFEEIVQKERTSRGIKLLRTNLRHLKTVARLPKVKDHEDPFDLLIIAQAMTENLTILTSDPKFGSHAVSSVL
jgi:PIN domain nuclease of toxin-antitoxin system